MSPRVEAPGPNLPAIDSHRWLDLYRGGRHRDLLSEWLSILDTLGGHDLDTRGGTYRAYIDAFARDFLTLFSYPDLEVAPALGRRFIEHNANIANLAAVSVFETTDPWLELVLGQEGNLWKVLTLYSLRNRRFIEPSALFDLEPRLASLWYAHAWLGADTFDSPYALRNGRSLVRSLDRPLVHVGLHTGSAYMKSTYVDPDGDRVYKQAFNRCAREQLAGFEVRNEPDPGSIAIVTARWIRGTAVYNSAYGFVEALRERYRLTLVHLHAGSSGEPESGLFDEVVHVRVRDDRLMLEPIFHNDFALAYYPDVGMEPLTRFMSNLRIAPIQVMGYGHPVSTHGSRIDYFIGGQEVEPVATAAQRFSERLVLIPGLGAIPVGPTRVRRDIEPDDPLTIGCAWGPHKCNHETLELVRQVLARSDRPVRLRLLTGCPLGRLSYPAFEADVRRHFGDLPVETFGNLPNAHYLDRLEACTFTVDSYPFGGYNSVVDALHLGRPCVVFEGRHSYNRLAAGLMRQLGLDELIVSDVAGYQGLIDRLIREDGYREALSARIAGIDVVRELTGRNPPENFRLAIEHLLENHDSIARLPAGEVIRVGGLEGEPSAGRARR